MRSPILAFAVAGALALTGAAGVFAQEATPEAATMEEGLFGGLGLPEIAITVSEAGFSVDQTEISSGRYLVTLNDETGNPELSTSFARLDEGETLEDLSYADEIAAGTPAPGMEEEVPIESFLFLYDNYIAGGPTAASPQVVVDLPAGDYAVSEDNPFTVMPAVALTVTGDPEARVEGPEPEATVSIVELGEGGAGYEFTVDGELRAGPQVVKIVNASDQPHFVFAWQYPEPIDMDQVMATFMFDPSSGATPSPDVLDFEQISFAGYASTQSIGTTQWVTMDLAAGQALLVCFVPDPEAGGVPHAFEGMLQLVDVAES